MPIALVIAAIAALGGFFLFKKAPAAGTPLPAGQPLALGFGPVAPPVVPDAGTPPALVSGQWYRLTVQSTAPDKGTGLGSSQADLKAQGFFPQVMIAVHATTKPPFVWTVPGHYSGTATAFVNTPTTSVLKVEEVAAPPQAVQAQMTPATLDANIPVDIATAVQTALSIEKNPDGLLEFATVLLPDFPVAASVLKSQSALLKAGATATSGADADAVDRVDAAAKTIARGVDAAPAALERAVGGWRAHRADDASLERDLAPLGRAARHAVHELVGRMVADSRLAGLTADELARRLHVAPAVARAALACVALPETPGTGVVLVKAARLSRLGQPKVT